MRATLRILLISALAIATMGIATASASAVVVKNSGVTCGAISGGPEGSGNPFTGGCAVTAFADHSILTTPLETLDCSVEIPDAVIGGDGAAGINDVIIDDRTAGNSAECVQVVPCTLDEPALPWSGQVSGTADPFDFEVTFCVVTPQTGVVAGPTQGTVTNGDCLGNPPKIEFDNAQVGTTGSTLTATFVVDPCTLTVE